MSDDNAFTIRSYRASDRIAVRQLCCQTGFLGTPIDPVYEDRQLFAAMLDKLGIPAEKHGDSTGKLEI